MHDEPGYSHSCDSKTIFEPLKLLYRPSMSQVNYTFCSERSEGGAIFYLGTRGDIENG